MQAVTASSSSVTLNKKLLIIVRPRFMGWTCTAAGAAVGAGRLLVGWLAVRQPACMRRAACRRRAAQPPLLAATSGERCAALAGGTGGTAPP